ncbi:threonine synthase [Synergistales bacterium]|nr:threonine synthase [Synergistales bacterium]
MWRYDKAYPIKKTDVSVSFGEGLSPLASICWMGRNLLVKMDHLMPTGSFKDRGVVIVINYLKNLGVTAITEDSSGNAAASNAAYAALAGMDCSIFVPSGTSQGKLAQTRMYGAQVHEVKGSRDMVAKAAQENIGNSRYAGHNWHPLFVQGTKSAAYEIWEQNGFRAPDNVVCPVGNGSMLIGAYLGFKELLNSGEVAKMPRMFGVQSANCNTIHRVFHGLSVDYSPAPTVAEGISLYRPVKTDEIVQIVKETSGSVDAVSENEIIDALKSAGKKGLYIEPTSAVAFAGFSRLILQNVVSENEMTVVIVSASGLKATDKILTLL